MSCIEVEGSTRSMIVEKLSCTFSKESGKREREREE